MQEEKIKLAQQILELANNSVTAKDLQEVLLTVLAKITEVKQASDADYNDLRTTIEEGDRATYAHCDQIERDLKRLIEKLKTEGSDEAMGMMGECKQEIEEIRQQFATLGDLTALENKVASVSDKVSFVTEATKPDETIKTINRATTKINRERVEGLDEELKRLEKIGESRGGGVSNLRIQQAFKYILKTEQPSGLINGVNTTYTVSQDIFAVLGFSLNGETIAQLPNYTIRGRQVVFSTALPAAYSGKDFEIKYI